MSSPPPPSLPAIPAVIAATVPAAAIVLTTSPLQSSLVTAIPAIVVVPITVFVAHFAVTLVASQSWSCHRHFILVAVVVASSSLL
ncbi:hypothetical protein EDB89DRAFT_1993148, partial [Lactarius sanguifluus]